MTAAESPYLPTLNTRLLTVGGALTVAGTALSAVGASLAAAALISAARQWSRSDQAREVAAKARVASKAAADAWRSQAPGTITLPDARRAADVPARQR